MTKEDIEKMTNEELIAEINASEQMLEICYGKTDLYWNDMLWREAGRRHIEVQKSYTLKDNAE